MHIGEELERSKEPESQVLQIRTSAIFFILKCWKKCSNRPGVLEKTDSGNGKPTYFSVWPSQFQKYLTYEYRFSFYAFDRNGIRTYNHLVRKRTLNKLWFSDDNSYTNDYNGDN